MNDSYYFEKRLQETFAGLRQLQIDLEGVKRAFEIEAISHSSMKQQAIAIRDRYHKRLLEEAGIDHQLDAEGNIQSQASPNAGRK